MKPIRVLSNADAVIDLLSLNGPLTPAEIAEETGIPRPTVYRLLEGLESVGMTVRHTDQAAGLSLGWLRLSDAARGALTEWSGARGVLDRLVEHTDQTAYLCVRREDEAVCVEWAQGRGVGILMLKPGRSLPLYAGAAGRTLLAFGPDASAYLERADLQRLTATTLTTPEELRADVETSRRDGFVSSIDDVTEGISALGVPVRDARGRLAGSLSLGGLTRDVLTRRDEFVDALIAAADDVGAVAD